MRPYRCLSMLVGGLGALAMACSAGGGSPSPNNTQDGGSGDTGSVSGQGASDAAVDAAGSTEYATPRVADGCASVADACQLTTMVTGLSRAPGAFSVTETHLYFVSDHTVQRIPVGGGEVEIVLEAPYGLTSAAVDEEYVYFTSAEAADPVVGRAPLDGSSEIVVLDDQRSQPHDIEVADGQVCYTDRGEGGGLFVVSAAGGAPSQLAFVSQAGIVEPFGPYVYFEGVAAPGEAAALLRLPRSGGAQESLGPALSRGTLALNDGGVYWTSSSEGLMHVPLGGGNVENLVATDSDEMSVVAVDRTHVYYNRYFELLRANLDGSSPALVATLTELPTTVRVNDTTAFVGVREPAAVYSLNKCGCP